MENIFEKYAVVYEKENGSIKYTALKCEVKEEIKRYLVNGETINIYKVNCDGKEFLASNIYDSLEEAKIIANYKNVENKVYDNKMYLDSKYPSKYGVLALFEYDQNNKIYLDGYIASKCYIIEEVVSNVKIQNNNEAFYLKSPSYKVLFPYDNIISFKKQILDGNELNLGKISYPEFLVRDKDNYLRLEFPEYALDGIYTNVHNVYSLYDTFEEAKKEAIRSNEYMIKRKITYLNEEDSNEYKETIYKEYEDKFKIYYLYEEMIRKEMDDVKKLTLSKK